MQASEKGRSRLARQAPRVVANCLYRIRVSGSENIPASGGAVLIGNHVSFMDVVVLLAVSPRPIRFIGAQWLFDRLLFRRLMRAYGVISLSPGFPRRAIKEAVERLKSGELVCLFPEGGISRDGSLRAFKPGFAAMAKEAGVPVIPFYLDGLWGSLLSYSGGRLFWKCPRMPRSRVSVAFGERIDPNEADTELARQKVIELRS